MRQKDKFSSGQLSRLAIMYSRINQGSNVFWQELEKQLLIKSSHFKIEGEEVDEYLINVIESFCRGNR